MPWTRSMPPRASSMVRTISMPAVRPLSVFTLVSSGRGGGALGTAALALALSLLGLGTPAAWGNACAMDDREREVCLEAPAQHIAALSPGATELVYAAGAGERVVAVVAFSDYPPEAREVPSVGNLGRIDLERLVTLQPDLVIGWVTGNPVEQLDTIEALGIPVFYIEPRDIEEIGRASCRERVQ